MSPIYSPVAQSSELGGLPQVISWCGFFRIWWCPWAAGATKPRALLSPPCLPVDSRSSAWALVPQPLLGFCRDEESIT